MSAEREIASALAEKMADDRAHRIASDAAAALIRCMGVATGGVDEYAIPESEADDHVRECVAHLCWHGEAASWERDDGHIVVLFGDFTSAR